jgi:hypothetical protein
MGVLSASFSQTGRRRRSRERWINFSVVVTETEVNVLIFRSIRLALLKLEWMMDSELMIRICDERGATAPRRL